MAAGIPELTRREIRLALLWLQRHLLGNPAAPFSIHKGSEIDFHALFPSGDTALIQVCTDASDPATFQREIRSLQEVRALHPGALLMLLLLEPLPPGTASPADILILPAIKWFLEEAMP